jgi:hypothetical protein
VDPDGMEIRIYTGDKDEDGNEEYVIYTPGMQYIGNSKFVGNMVKTINKLQKLIKGTEVKNLIFDLVESENTHEIS